MKYSGFNHRSFWCLLAGFVILQLPFLTSAFRIDEPTFLAMTRQILVSPLDPYGFRIHWLGGPEPAFGILANPPLVPAWLALWHQAFPWNEGSFRVAVLPFSLMALLGMALLAERFGVRRELALALLCCSPAFFLAGQVVMPDMAMLGFLMVAVGAALQFEATGSRGFFLASLISSFFAPLAKYSGIILIPLLCWLFLSSRRKRAFAVLAASPILSLLVWNGFTWLRYGSAHTFAIAAFQEQGSLPVALMITGVMCSLGLGVLPLSSLFIMPSSYRRFPVIWILLLVPIPAVYWIARKIGYPRLSAVLFAAAITLAIHILLLAIIHAISAVRSRDMASLFLTFWVLAGLAFQGGLMFTSVRYLLFLAPPIIILVLRHSDRLPGKMILTGALGANLIFVMGIALGDQRIGNIYRDVFKDQSSSLAAGQGGRVYFSGTWGFLYYAERMGGRHVELAQVNPANFHNGDILFVAATPWPPLVRPPVRPGQRAESRTFSFDPRWPLRTIDCSGGINFYGSLISHCPRPTFLPWGFALGPSETFTIYSFKND